jgi:hypothetical protein
MVARTDRDKINKEFTHDAKTIHDARMCHRPYPVRFALRIGGADAELGHSFKFNRAV